MSGEHFKNSSDSISIVATWVDQVLRLPENRDVDQVDLTTIITIVKAVSEIVPIRGHEKVGEVLEDRLDYCKPYQRHKWQSLFIGGFCLA